MSYQAHSTGALAPVISGEIIEFHHAKHHATYVANLNVAEEKLAEAQAKNDVSAIIQGDLIISRNFKI